MKKIKYITDSLQFAFQLADMAKKITLWVKEIHTKRHPNFEMVSIVREIMRRNCKELEIFNDNFTATFSDSGIEKLVEVSDIFFEINLYFQICNHVDKKVIVRAVVENKEIGIGSQLGLFHVSVGVTSMSDLTINHLELDKEY